MYVKPRTAARARGYRLFAAADRCVHAATRRGCAGVCGALICVVADDQLGLALAALAGARGCAGRAVCAADAVGRGHVFAGAADALGDRAGLAVVGAVRRDVAEQVRAEGRSVARVDRRRELAKRGRAVTDLTVGVVAPAVDRAFAPLILWAFTRRRYLDPRAVEARC